MMRIKVKGSETEALMETEQLSQVTGQSSNESRGDGYWAIGMGVHIPDLFKYPFWQVPVAAIIKCQAWDEFDELKNTLW
ncbi:hypothetical protein NC653_003715 [Populus alba x Populus x berolinensis]|uniref:Uncharacterized protein n=1 Tax=Populus alba x Populus x berolinensis TaxID=444605 RepID=A0AAD6RSE6_9ROSI|nr:hypothetical protein NC653_003715 [Populus alba x Populus x berolinensis]